MPILHTRITKQNQPIDLSRTLHSQNLTLRRIIVTRNASIPSNLPAVTIPAATGTPGAPSVLGQPPYFTPIYTDPTDDLKGGIIIDVSFFKGWEMLSNFSSNDLFVPFGNEVANVDNTYTQNFANEDISLSFNVQTYDFERKDTLKFVGDAGVTATTPAAIKFIDVFWEFDELFAYNNY